MQAHKPSPIRRLATAFGVAVWLFASSTPASAVGPDSFLVRTTADMVALCAAEPSQPNYVAAIHFCHGFAAGAYQFYTAMAAASDAHYVCVPDPPPARSTAIADFVAWMKQNPRYSSDPPIDSMFRYLGTRYPCPAENAKR